MAHEPTKKIKVQRIVSLADWLMKHAAIRCSWRKMVLSTASARMAAIRMICGQGMIPRKSGKQSVRMAAAGMMLTLRQWLLPYMKPACGAVVLPHTPKWRICWIAIG